MLPYGVGLLRVLHLRQHLVMTSNLNYRRLSNKVRAHGSPAFKKLQLRVNTRSNLVATLSRRPHSTKKDSKILAGPLVPQAEIKEPVAGEASAKISPCIMSPPSRKDSSIKKCTDKDENGGNGKETKETASVKTKYPESQYTAAKQVSEAELPIAKLSSIKECDDTIAKVKEVSVFETSEMSAANVNQSDEYSQSKSSTANEIKLSKKEEESIKAKISEIFSEKEKSSEVSDTIMKQVINEATTSPRCTVNPVAPVPTPTKTKKLEVKTSKGVLSVTTTIEDSKINTVVFEKRKDIKEPPIPPAATTIEEVNQSKQAADAVGRKETVDSKEATGAVAKETQKGKTTSGSTVRTIMKEVEAVVNEIAAKRVAKKEAKEEAKMAASTSGTAAASAENSLTKAPAPEVAKKPRVRVDFNRSSLERNFVTPARAMSDFLLKQTDLESLPKIKRRSPYEQEPPITVYWRKDVEAKAIEVWGSRENLMREILKREIERKKHQQNIFTIKRRLRDYRREVGSRTTAHAAQEAGLTGKSGRVVLIAIGINATNFIFKAAGWVCTGSHSMFAETIHSLADTINQMILAYGIHKSTQMADSDHPYGYSNMKYVSSLISGVGIFCVGTGLSLYHGITGLIHPEPMVDFFWAFLILGGSLLSEGATLLVAAAEVRRAAKAQGVSFRQYVLSGKDPCVNVVLTEDAAAVTSVAVAVTCMGLTQLTGSPLFDAIGSLLVGVILGSVASFIIYTNATALVGKSIAEDHLKRINAELESDVMIRAIHDVKGIDMGNSLVRYKAEMDFDGRELTRSYLDKQDLNELLKIVKSFQSVEELEQFLLKHGESIVDLMGGEIDRIEMRLRKKFPEIRHCDLEIL